MNGIGSKGYFSFELFHLVHNDRLEYGNPAYEDELVKPDSEYMRVIIESTEN